MAARGLKLPVADGSQEVALLNTYPAPLRGAALAATWDTAWLSIRRRTPPGLRAELMNAWSEPGRHHCDGRHLGECLALWVRWQGHCERPGEVAIALWFHEAVHDPRQAESASNTLGSAAWAARSLASTGLDSDAVQRVHDLVMATQTETLHGLAEPAGQRDRPDSALVVDIDLAVLGSPPERFERYDQDVRRSVGRVPGTRYRTARMQVLESWKKRNPLYRTAAAVALLEHQARINLDAAVSRLAQ